MQKLWRADFFLRCFKFQIKSRKSKTASFCANHGVKITYSHAVLAFIGTEWPWSATRHPSFSCRAAPLFTMMMRRLWEAGQQPGLGRWLLWWPSPRGGAERLWHWGDSENEGGHSLGSSSTSKPSAGPSAGPGIHRWLALRPGMTPSWPRPPGCPHWCVRRRAPPECRMHVWI